MARCSNCHGCLHTPHRKDDIIYFICKLCKKVYIENRKFGRDVIEEVIDIELKNKLLENINMERID